MANAYTDSTSGSLGTSLVQTAYDRYVEFALRAVPMVRDVADKKPVQPVSYTHLTLPTNREV